PGYGLSPADEPASLAKRTDDHEAILDHLGLERVALLGISGGAPYAVALASRLGSRASALALVSPMGPVADMEADKLAADPDLPRGKRWFFMELPKRRAALRAFS